ARSSAATMDALTVGPFGGVVVDERDGPIADAVVHVVGGWRGTSSGKASGLDRADFPTDVRTGSDGRFEFTLRTPMQPLDVTVSAPERLPHDWATSLSAGWSATIRMQLARPLRILVQNPDGTPADGALVDVNRVSPDMRSDWSGFARENGRVEIKISGTVM